LQIIAFPCSQFLNQESKPNAAIKRDINKRFGVNFPLMDKIDVNGVNAHPVFRYLRANTKELINSKDPNRMNAIPWNFCRWVVDRSGKI
jgi:glutathione peroxidase